MKTFLTSIHFNVFRRVLLSWALASLVGTVLAVIGVGGELEQQLKDMRANLLEKPASGEIVLVEIDAKSLQAMDRWPWPREYYGRLIDILTESGVSQIAFDIDFSAYSSAEQDKIFANAIANSDATIVLPTFRQQGSSGQSSHIESLPIEVLRENAFLASVNVHPDKRGQLNQYSFGTMTADTPRPSLASMVAEVSGNIEENFVIDQSINPATLPRVSFVDILGSDNQPTELLGKKVLVGATAIELGDRYPISRFGVVPGVVIQAMAAETLLQGTNIPNFGKYPPLLFATILLLGCILTRKFSDKALVWITWSLGLLLVCSLLVTEYLNHFTFSNVPTFFALGTFLIVRKLLTTDLALKMSRFFNEASKLPNDAAMLRYISDKSDCHIATARLSNFHELLVVTDKNSRMEMFNSLADRLKFLALEERIFHVDTDIMAWVIKNEYAADVDGHFDTANVLFQSPVMAGTTKIKINPAFGSSNKSIDKAMVASEQAHATGKRWVSHDDDVDQAIGQKLNLLVELDQAIQNRELRVVYQPKWDLQADELNGAEALVRWNHAGQGMISPAIFIPMLEKVGRIDDLTCFVLEHALQDLSSWGARQENLSCSVNISAQLLGDSKFVEKVIAMVESANVACEQVIFEVTETAALADPELSVLALNRIRDAGIKISIDDYGTGQSTMSYLQRLPVNEIKIDQSFVRTMTTNNANHVMVKSTIEMAHALGFKVVAEGIEDQQCKDLLTQHGCDVGQGWHISKAVTSEVFQATWLGIESNALLKSA